MKFKKGDLVVCMGYETHYAFKGKVGGVYRVVENKLDIEGHIYIEDFNDYHGGLWVCEDGLNIMDYGEHHLEHACGVIKAMMEVKL